MRLIDADALIVRWKAAMLHMVKDKKGQHPISMETLVEEVKRASTIDAVPVVQGQWIVLDECSNAGTYCSVCHKKVYKECYGNCKMKSTYCPNCGAKMDLEE